MKMKAYAAIVTVEDNREISDRKPCEIEIDLENGRVRVAPEGFTSAPAREGGEAVLKFFQAETGPDWIAEIRADGRVYPGSSIS